MKRLLPLLLTALTFTFAPNATLAQCPDGVIAEFNSASFGFFGCAPLVANFSDESSVPGPATIVSWDWDFGNGDSSTDSNPTYTYQTPGVYNISLTVTTSNGCADTETKPAFAQAIGPDVNFGANSLTVGDAPLTVNFTDSTIFGAPIVAWDWDFGDGGTSNLQNPTYTYTTEDVYDVSLTVTDIDGCSRTFTRNDFVKLPAIQCQDIVVELDATGNYTFDTPLTPQTDAEVLTSDGSSTSVFAWQSFTPTVDGILNSINVTYSSIPSNPTVDVVIRSGQGTGGPQLGSAETITVTASGVGVPTLIDLNQTIDLTAGVEYTFELQGFSAQEFLKDGGDPYAGGISSFGAGTDLVFNIGILQRPEIDNGTTDDNGLASFGLSQTDFTCADAGTTIPVTLTATDNLGNTGSCIANVTVADDEDPVASCVTGTPAPVTTTFSSTAAATPIPDNTAGGATMPIAVTGITNINEVTVDVNIEHTWAGDLILTLQSPTGTTITLVDRPGYTGAGFGCNTDGLDLTFDDTSVDDLETTCPGGTSPITGSYFPLNALSAFDTEDANGTWTLFVSDNGAGDTGSILDWDITISGDGLPTPIQLSLDATGNYTVDPLNDIDAGSSDNCGVTLATSPASFTCADLGLQSITLTATDPTSNSSSCVTTVNVIDNTAPDAQCQPFTLVLDPSGSGTLTTGDINNSSSDNCGIASLALDITTFNCSNIGANTVELTVEDNNGLVSTCSETVTVEDNEVPVFVNCPTNIEVCADDATGVTVTYATITATDNCSSSVSQTDVSGLTNGNLFPIGVTPQQWTATDGTNSVACDFNVIVNATPVADYNFSAACQGEAVFFTDESTIDASTNISFWNWNMGDGSGPILLVDPIHSFADTGMFDVTLLVETAEGCVDVVTQTVHVTPVPVAGFTFVGDCEGNATVFTNTSSIDAFPSSSTLTSAWDFGDSNTSTLDSPSHVYALDGTYTVTLTVTSDNGCEDVITQSVTVSDSPTALFSASTECEGTATTFTNLSTGDGTLTYNWDFGDLSPASTDPNPTYTYATDGVYTVLLTTTNDNGCVDTHTASVTVNNLPAASFTFSDVCEGTAADFVNTSDAGTYNWDLGDGNSSTLTNVSHVYSSFGTYDVTLTVTSPAFCISSVTQTIEIFDLPDFALTPTDVLCYGESTGELVAIAVPPAATPWTLSIDGGTPQASVTFGALAAGTYDITAFDANGCEFTVSGTVSQPTDTLGISVNSTVDVLCNGEATGEINVNGTGGTSPYMYSVDAGAQQMTGMFAGLEAGVHDIQIVDANLCVFDTVITLTEPDTLVLTLVNAEDLLCNGDNSGEIAVVGTGGVLDYEYNVDGGTYGSDSLFTGLSAGMHILGVLDANGCTDTLHVTLSEPGILQLSLVTANDAVCYEESNGSIEVAAASGTAPYQYSIDGVSFQGSALFEGLAAGTYTITVMDANGCLDELTETIFEPSLLTIETSSVPVACFGDASGEITVTADGGTPVYEYSNDGGISFDANGGLFSDVVTGNYLMVVRDANGCTASEGVIISQPASVFILDANVTDAACLDSTSGSVQLIGTGGTPTYLYSADNTSFDADGLVEGFGAGTYTLYGQDLNGCSDSVDVVIGEPSTSVEITSTILANPACPNEASGTATITAFGGTPGYTYSSNGGATYQAAATLTGLNGGNHLLFVQDANGCVDSDTITLVAPEIFDLTLDSIVGVDCEGDFTGEIHVTGVGGTPSYNYFLDGTSLQSNGDYIGLSDGVYAVSIMDVNGCTYAEDIEIVAAQMLPTADFDFAISGTAVAFENLSQFGDTYLWEFGDDSTSTEMSPVHVYAEDGNYDVTLTVTNSCGSETITILVSTTTIGINDNEVLTFGLYPNPTSNQLFIQPSMTVNTELTFEVISTSGQIILTKQIARMDNAETVQLDVSGMASGIYYLKIVGNDQQSVLRFDIIK